MFAKRVLTWFDQHGRKDLPWQKTITPYRVWVSEIMLQQTQVNTVIPYFQKFITRIPNTQSLANAEQDEVLHYWTGLGYYARARNLQRAAQIIETTHKGQFPSDLAALESLPGIGRSTAGAILSIAFQQPAAILDGNVKRVLCRYNAVNEWPGKSSVAEQLWKLAESTVPTQRPADYTQAMMDLGATICTRTKPKCTQCPLASDCIAHAQARETDFPIPKIRKTIPIRTVQMLLLCNEQGEILLEKRPPAGIWGGLWSFPECPTDETIGNYCQQRYACRVSDQTALTTFRHTFSHFHLDITPVKLTITGWEPSVMETPPTLWYHANQKNKVGLAAPVKKLLSEL
jgi:A/G-specific adenine glycosylase